MSADGPVLLLRFVRKDRSRLMRALAWVLAPLLGGREAFLTRWWTTLGSTIYYPIGVGDPAGHRMVEHEAVHARQFHRWGWCVMVALYLLVPGGRWLIEREAYLLDVLSGRLTPEQAAAHIWRYYLWPWPRCWMRRWFEEKIKEHQELPR